MPTFIRNAQSEDTVNGKPRPMIYLVPSGDRWEVTRVQNFFEHCPGDRITKPEVKQMSDRYPDLTVILTEGRPSQGTHRW